MYPLWASEGLATFFEGCLDPNASCKSSKVREKRLLQLYRDNNLIELGRFVWMNRAAGNGCDIDIYAQAWGFFDYLFTTCPEKLWQYFEYLQTRKPGPRGGWVMYDEFVQAFGPIEDIESRWLEHLRQKSDLIGPD